LTDPDFVDKGEFEKFARTWVSMEVFVVLLLASFFVVNYILPKPIIKE